jgi:hypothetical protein
MGPVLEGVKMTVKQVVKEGVKSYFSDTPKWVKIVRLVGVVMGAIGGTILASNPVTLPVALVAAAPYMVMVGNFTALIVQGFSK